MKRKWGFRDKIFRLLLAVAVILLFIENVITGPLGVGLVVAAVIFLVVSFIGFRSFSKTKRSFHDQERLSWKTAHPYYYHVNVSWTKGQQELHCSPELNLPGGKNGNIEIATEAQLPYVTSGVWSPEQLFTAAVSSCLMSAFIAAAEKEKLEFTSFVCPSEGKLERQGENLVISEVTLHPTITLTHERFKSLGEKVLEQSLEACLISHSVKSKVTLRPLLRFGGSLN